MLRHFLDDFMSFVPLQMPQLLNVATMEEPQFYGCLLYTSDAADE